MVKKNSDEVVADQPTTAGTEEAPPAPRVTRRRKAAPAVTEESASSGPATEEAPGEEAQGEAVADTAPESAPTSSRAQTAPPREIPKPVSPTQLIFAGPDPELFKKFQDLPAIPDVPERSVRRRERQRPAPDQAPRSKTVQEEQPSQPQKVRGSTRLEAKRQRRRDGRDQGRRRTVVTETEFLARRESVERIMVVREKSNRTQIAVLEDGVVVEHYVAKSDESSLIGNVYLGRVQNVLPSMEAAFVDIGRGRNAVLYSGEVDWDAATLEGGEKPKRIEAALKTGDTVLVQVTKDPVGHKGARLTSQISLPGRYLVYVPGGGMNGISRKLPDTERARLKTILKKILPETAGVIVRTAAEGATEEQLTEDVQRLQAQWEALQASSSSHKAPSLLHSEPDLLIKIIRDVFNEDFQSLVIDGAEAHTTISGYLGHVAPDLLQRVHRYEADTDVFDHYRISEGIHKALERKVWLPSGGSLVIDRTEAMTVVDVNTGKFVGSGGNLEETVTKNNLEAAEEIVRQLRLRDIGGIIVIDFIDMVLETNRDLVLRRLMECLSRDRTKHQVAEVTSLGLVQMTRKRLGLGLLESFSETCDHCQGRGLIIHSEPVGKSRSQSSESPSSSRRKKGLAAPTPAATAHQLTDDARAAIWQIAQSTVGVSAGTNGVTVAEDGEPQESANEASASPVAADLSVALQAEDVTGLAGLSKRPARRGRVKAPAILDQVLEALPEPPAPGTSRRRRRASTGGVVTPSQGAGEATGGAS